MLGYLIISLGSNGGVGGFKRNEIPFFNLSSELYDAI